MQGKGNEPHQATTQGNGTQQITQRKAMNHSKQ
jgi:hypothetical protein